MKRTTRKSRQALPASERTKDSKEKEFIVGIGIKLSYNNLSKKIKEIIPTLRPTTG
jgi:hypothetical protein